MGSEAVALLQGEMDSISDLHGMHGLMIDSFAGLGERVRDHLHNRNNILDLFLRRAALEFRKMEFHHLLQLYEALQTFLDPEGLGAAADQPAQFIPLYVRERIAQSVKQSADEIQIGIVLLSSDLPAVEYQNVVGIKSSRFAPYIQ